ncbi:PREDICTED: mitochondrial import inner membrane translocase subunit TIM44-2-like [Tarenaya hassleriana]|uniref:mitochondrial import inner membrane translocase subunit TIM44-2-like n=1 Tax=Tarenaya hassleriana TaxID=28532 RepID=UPI00053C718D|nr:PREDICTED: mitochondrial import inner membrane translocase subunit TIM44-2-like [Tarenaya hassleriana]
MASRKLVRDFLIAKHPIFVQMTHQRRVNARLGLLPAHGSLNPRPFSVFGEFSKKIKGEAESNPEFQRTVKELKERAEELKGVKEGLKERTKQTTEQLHKQAEGVWSEAEAVVKKVSSDVKDKISAATEEVKETLKFGKQESAGSTESTSTAGTGTKDAGTGTFEEEKQHQQSGPTDSQETLFGKFKSTISSPKVSGAFSKLKEAKVADLAKKGYDIVKDELRGAPSKKKHLECTPTPQFTGERSTRTEMVVVPTKQPIWRKKWEAFREKMQGHPVFKRLSGISEPVVNKSQEIAEDVRERWETSDSPIVHKIQDINDTIFQETDSAASYKEIRRRDPSFSLPDFVAEVQEAIRPVLNAYMKADVETLKNYCSPEVIERCKAEHDAYKSHGIFYDNKLLHISEVEVRETKMMGTSPIIIVAFQTQQIYCVRDRNGAITEGGKDTIQTVYYAWAMQQVEPEELGEGALYPIWRLREMQQLGVQALI